MFILCSIFSCFLLDLSFYKLSEKIRNYLKNFNTCLRDIINNLENERSRRKHENILHNININSKKNIDKFSFQTLKQLNLQQKQYEYNEAKNNNFFNKFQQLLLK
jgi:hypothetical protein